MNNPHSRGQGSLELTLLMGGAVLIAFMVVALLLNTTASQSELVNQNIDDHTVALNQAAFGDTYGPNITSFTATSIAGGIQLSWTAIDGKTPIHYYLARQEEGIGKLNTMSGFANFFAYTGNGVEYAPAPDDSTGFTDTYYLIAGKTYYYKLLACDNAAPSNCSVSGIASADYTGNPSDTTPPNPPALFQANPLHGQVLLTWNPNTESDIQGYRLYRSIIEDGTPKPAQYLLTILSPTTAHLDALLTNGVSYQYSLTALDTSGNEGGASVLQTKPSAVVLGGMEMVYDAGTPPFNAPNGCGTLDVPDTAADAFRDSTNTIHLYSVFYNSRRMIGNTFNTLTRDCFPTSYPNTPAWVNNMNGVTHPTGWDSDYTKFNDEEWLSTPYYLGGNDVYMLVHNEFHPEAHDTIYPDSTFPECDDTEGCQPYTTVTSAYSTDGGKTYTQNPLSPGYRVATLPDTFVFNPSSEAIGYGGHSNLIEKDGYMYSMVHVIDDPYVAGKQMLCLIRTPLPLTKDSVWKGYSGGTSFNADLRGPDSCTPINNPDIATMHTSLTYNTFFGKYMLVGTHGQWVDMGNPGGPQLMTGIYYSLSDDLINWEKSTLIAFAKMPWTEPTAPGVEVLSPLSTAYPSIIDHDSTDPNFNTVDQTAYLYVSLGTPGIVTHQLVRYPITFLPKP